MKALPFKCTGCPRVIGARRTHWLMKDLTVWCTNCAIRLGSDAFRCSGTRAGVACFVRRHTTEKRSTE